MNKLKKIKCKNFRLFEDIELELDDKGLAIITAVNKDIPGASSNMAGKSTLLHAITWCLYGCDTLGNPIADSAIHNNKDFCEVILELSDSTVIKRVRNRKSSPKVLIHFNSETGTPDEKQVLIDAKLGEKQLFLAAHIFGYDEAYKPFAKSTDKEQKGLFDLLIPTEDIELAEQRTRDKLTKCKDTIQKLENKTYLLTHNVENINDALKAIESSNTAEVNKLKQELKELKTKLKTNEEKKLSKELKQLKDDISKAETNVHYCQSNIETFEVRVSDVTRLLGKLEDSKCPTCGSKITEKNKTKQTNEYNNKIKEYRTKIKEYKDTQKENSNTIKQLKPILDKKKEEYNNLKSHNREVNSKLKYITENLNEKESNTPSENINELKRKIKTNKNKIRIYNDTLEHQQHQKELYEFWLQGFGRSGIKAYRLNEITPILNDIAKEYSDKLYGDSSYVEYSTQKLNKNGEYADKFSMVVKDSKDKIIETLSAGQAMRRDLIHLFSIVELSELLDKRTLDLLVFDEAFRTIDKQGANNIIEILEELTNNIGTILVIEHDDEYAALFPKQYIVERNNNQSTIKEA